MADGGGIRQFNDHCRNDARANCRQCGDVCRDAAARLSGALVATMGCILPSLLLVSLLSVLYARFRSGRAMQTVLGSLRPVVVALIASAALSIVQVAAVRSNGAVSLPGVVLMVVAFAALRWKKWNPILVMLASGACGAVLHALGWL